MSLEDVKKQILTNIDKINNFALLKLYPTNPSVAVWNNLSSEELKRLVESTIGIARKIKKYPIVLEDLSFNYLNDLNNHFNDFVNQYQPLESLDEKQITSQHHAPLNTLHAISNIFRTSGVYTELKLKPDFADTVKKLKEANKELKDFDVNNFTKAIALVDDLITKKVSFEDKTIKESLGTFLNRADEHKIHRSEKFLSWKFSGHWWWLFFAGVMGVIIAFIVASFISVLESNGGVDIGSAILRVSSLIIPSYFMVFFINQFTYHKRMYEIYSFKNTSLNTMTDLMQTNKEKSDDILERGLDVLFTEPKIKESGKYDTQLVTELIGMIKNQTINKP
ncbi:MAG: hypothetical protein U9O55_00290 [Patescibacteria group bacterium]|nr:hypothetical protein [Patescibacteria group bacterium]